MLTEPHDMSTPLPKNGKINSMTREESRSFVARSERRTVRLHPSSSNRLHALLLPPSSWFRSSFFVHKMVQVFELCFFELKPMEANLCLIFSLPGERFDDDVPLVSFPLTLPLTSLVTGFESGFGSGCSLGSAIAKLIVSESKTAWSFRSIRCIRTL